ncbi:MAG: hypothetical protein M9965_12145 [Anaerolineae bacterium]|nr:hypothetical protein [Anaerolineae bacterium]
MAHIGTLTESSLHAALKRGLAQPGDRLEHEVDGYVIDIVRDDRLLEIQTGNFSGFRRKLAALLPSHPIHVYLPLALDKWIVRVSAENQPISRRKSPKHSRPVDAFSELVYIGHLLPHPNLTVSLVLTQEEELWRDDGKGSWRRKRWSIADRVLLNVIGEITLHDSADYLALLPDQLSQPFTNRDLATALACHTRLAQKITYTLQRAGLLVIVGKQGNAHQFGFESAEW